MGKQENIYKIIYLFLFILLSQYSFAIDYNKLKIAATINNKNNVTEQIILQDKDSISLFLIDENGNKFDSDKNLKIDWWIILDANGDTFKKNLQSDNHCKVSFKVTPSTFDINNSISNLIFIDGYPRYEGIFPRGEIQCTLYTEYKNYTYHLKMGLNVLPPAPEVELLETYIKEEGGNSFPVAIFKINAKNFDQGRMCISDPERPGHEYFVDEFIDENKTMPVIFTCDYFIEGAGFRFESWNDYGCTSSYPIYVTPTASVTNLFSENENINIHIQNGSLNIKSKCNMKKIYVSDLKGHIILNESQKNNATCYLKRGIYLIKVIQDNSKTTNYKILIP